MKKLITKVIISLWLLFIVFNFAAFAQFTNVTATITDSDSIVWTNAQVSISFQPNPNQPNLASYNINGVALTSVTYSSYLQQAVTTNGSGTLSLTLLDNQLITPAGSSWHFVIRPNASVQATSYNPISVTGGSQSLTSYLSSNSIAPRLPALPGSSAYADVEIQPIPNVGGFYFNTTASIQRIWNGTAWQNGAGGGGTIPNTTNVLKGSGITGVAVPANLGTDYISPNITNGMKPLGTANSGANFNSNIFNLCGSYWDGSNPQPDCWTFQTTPLSGTNPYDILTILYNGSPTGGQINMPFSRYLAGFELQAVNGSGFIQFKGPPNMSSDYSIHWPALNATNGNTLFSCTPTDSANCTASWVNANSVVAGAPVTPQEFGGFGDAYAQPDGCSTTASNTTINCRDATFVSGDAGKQIWVPGAGAAGVAYHGAIVSVTDASNVVVTPAPSTSVGYGVLQAVYGHDDAAAVNSCMQYSANNGVQCILKPLPPPGGGNHGYTGFLIGSAGLILPANYLGTSGNITGSNYVTNLFCEFNGDCLSLAAGPITSAIVSNIAMIGDASQPNGRGLHFNATVGPFGQGGLWNSTFTNVLVNNFALECMWMDGGGGPGYTFNLPNQIDSFIQFQCDGPNQSHPANLIKATGQAAQILFENGQVNGLGTSNYPNYLIAIDEKTPTFGDTPVDLKFFGYTFEVGQKGLYVGNGSNNIHFDNGYVEDVTNTVFTLKNSPGFTFNGNHIASSGSTTAVGTLLGGSTASIRDIWVYGTAPAALAVCTGSNNSIDFAGDVVQAETNLLTSNCATATGGSAGGSMALLAAFSTASIIEPDSAPINTLSAPMVAPGKTLTLYAAGAFQLASGGNISLGGLTSPVRIPIGGSATLTLMDAGVTWLLTTTTGATSIAVRKGTFTCTAGGTISITNALETATSDVVISLNAQAGTISTAPAMKTVTAGTGFTVLCGAADTSIYNYNILN